MKCSMAAAVVLVSGCVGLDALDLGEVEQHAGGGCPEWMCGMNSPSIDSFGFHELSLDHAMNTEGFAFESLRKNNLNYEMTVDHGAISGTHPGAPKIEHTTLQGAILRVSYNGTGVYDIRITDVGRTAYWAFNGQLRYLETYVFQWTPTRGGYPTGEWQDLCPSPPGAADALGMDQHHTLVFEGERIDKTTKTIGRLDRRWFNIGCAGSTLAKLQLTGHTYAATAAGFSTTIAERQTMLKMLSGDVCGTGVPFTVAGQPLDWADDQGWMKVIPTTSEYLEARWTPTGASCLNKPRAMVHVTQLGLATFGDTDNDGLPDIEQAIQTQCAVPPPCANNDFAPSPEHLITANP